MSQVPASLPVTNINNDTSGQKEVSYIECSRDQGALETVEVTCPAVADAAQGHYFTFVAPDGDVVAVWLNLNGDDTPPAGATYTAADVKIEVNAATNDDGEDVAEAVAAAIVAEDIDDLSVTQSGDKVTIMSELMGPLGTPVGYLANGTAGGSFGVILAQAGALSDLQGGTFNVYDTGESPWVFWIDVNGEGEDPGGTDEVIEIPAGASASAIAAEIAAVITNAGAGFVASSDGPRVIVVAAANGEIRNIEDVNTGFEFSTRTEGRGAVFRSPGSATASLLNS
jgi:hypothetical protein